MVVGNEVYPSDMTLLPYAADDALGMETELSRLGFKVTVMTSESRNSDLRPTDPRKILNVVRAVSRSCEPADTFIVCLSGHGVQYVNDPLLATGVKESYFCPADADLDDKSTLLKISDLTAIINACRAERKLMLVDACQEEVQSEEGKAKSGKRQIQAGSVHESRRSVPKGMATLFSCSNGQSSWQHEPIRHSVFTHFVLEYLRGKAGQRYYDSGVANLHSLVAYVAKHTNDYVIDNALSTNQPQFVTCRAEFPHCSVAPGVLDPLQAGTVFTRAQR